MSDDKIKVTIAMDFSDALLERIRAVSPRLQVARHFPEVPESVWADTEVLYTSRRFPQPEQAPLLRWIQLHTAGIDHASHERIFRAEDITITTASGIHARHMAQFALMMILAFHFKLQRMFEMQQKAEWREDRYKLLAPDDLHLQTVGIIGYGSIGREIARLTRHMGMRVLAAKRDAKHPADTPGEYVPAGTGDPGGDLPDRIYPSEALTTMVRECDYVIVLTPLTPQTRHQINEQVLAAMKPTGILINLARGSIVDEAALINALAANRIGGAALDVFETEPLPAGSPLWQLDNVIITPHIAGNSAHYNEKAAELFIENLRHYVENKALFNRIDRKKGY